MTHGFEFYNPAGELVLHSNSKSTQCIGRTTYVSTTPPYNEGTVRRSGYSTHTFATNSPVLWAIELPVGYRVGIVRSNYSGGVYTLEVYCGANPDGNGFDTQYPIHVWAFSTDLGAPSSYGLQIFDTNGVMTHDLAKPNISFPLNASYDGSSVTLNSAVTNPVVIGNSPYYSVTYTDRIPDEPSSGYVKKDTKRFLLRASNGNVGYSSGTIFRSGTNSGGKPPNSTFSAPSPFIIVEGALLP
jgi:hypothetical protein